MRYLALAGKFLLFLLFLAFAAWNDALVALRFFLGLEWQAPLALILFVFFAAGLLIGLFLGAAKRWRPGRDTNKGG